MDKRKYALLDADFISKGFSVQKDEKAHLIDRVLELPGYRFFCHSQIVTELGRHTPDAPEVLSFTDAQILDNLESSMGTLACATYTQMLKESCDSFSRGYFIANVLGLGWAATPAGLKVMEELSKLEGERRRVGIERGAETSFLKVRDRGRKAGGGGVPKGVPAMKCVHF